MDQECKYFNLDCKKMWKECFRNRHLFEKRHSIWLQNEFRLPKIVLNLVSTLEPIQVPGTSRGRPQKPFCQASFKTKKRRVKGLVATRTSDELRFAYEIADQLSSTKKDDNHSSLSPQKALALYFDLDLSERKYNLLRKTVNTINENCFPSLYSLQKF